MTKTAIEFAPTPREILREILSDLEKAEESLRLSHYLTGFSFVKEAKRKLKEYFKLEGSK